MMNRFFKIIPDKKTLYLFISIAQTILLALFIIVFGDFGSLVQNLFMGPLISILSVLFVVLIYIGFNYFHKRREQ